MNKKAYPLEKVYTLIEQGPMVMLSTSLNGRPNIMTLSWHMMIDFVPPLVGCVISNRNYTFEVLEATGECVINIPGAELAKKAVGCGNTTGRETDKFEKFHLTPMKASQVRPPLIGECFANFECKVTDTRMVEPYGLFILEVVRAWVDPKKKNPRMIYHCGKDVFRLSGKTFRLKNRMK